MTRSQFECVSSAAPLGMFAELARALAICWACSAQRQLAALDQVFYELALAVYDVAIQLATVGLGTRMSVGGRAMPMQNCARS
jgi:hypothetical protein